MGGLLEKAGMGRSHPEVEAADPELARRMRELDAAPQYFPTRYVATMLKLAGGRTTDSCSSDTSAGRGFQTPSAAAGSIKCRTAEMRLAGTPQRWACSWINSALGAQ